MNAMHISAPGQAGDALAFQPAVAKTPAGQFLVYMMRLVIFTDIDGSLLDFDSYEPGPALPALEACRRAGVPVITCTSKPSAEVIDLRTSLRLDTPYIVENGAAIYIPADTPVAAAALRIAGTEEWNVSAARSSEGESFTCLLFGSPRVRIVEALGEIAGEVGIEVRGISDMEVEEITARTGLKSDQARAAKMREYSEPFIVTGERVPARSEERAALLELIVPSAVKRGLACTLGGRFFHLQGRHSKGIAVGKVVMCYSNALSYPTGSGTQEGDLRFRTMALGDAYNDAEMLASVDIPVLIRKPDGTFADGINLPGLVRTEGIGPQGWHEAVMRALEEL